MTRTKKQRLGPRLPSGRTRRVVMLVRLSDDEYERFGRRAQQHGLPLSTWARTALLEILEGKGDRASAPRSTR